MAVATLALQMGLTTLAGIDALAGTISVGAFAMIFFLANQIIRSVQELSYRMLDYFEQLGTLAEAQATQPGAADRELILGAGTADQLSADPGDLGPYRCCLLVG